MTAISRGFRNVYRNTTRTLIVILILSISIGVFLTMVMVDDGVNQEIEDVESNVDTSIEVRPAGSYGGFSTRPGGMGGGGFGGGMGGSGGDTTSYVPSNYTDLIDSVPHVNATYRTVTQMDMETRSMYNGIENDAEMVIMGGGVAEFVGGLDLSYYGPDDDVAVIGLTLAEDNGYDIGETMDVNGTSVEIVGIFSSGQRFGDRQIYLPVDSVIRIFNLTESISSITVIVDSVENVEFVYETLQMLLDTEVVDVVNSDDENEETIESLEDIAKSSEISALLALLVGCVIVFFIMMLVTRERRKEIGTLKAIGASDLDVISQFMVEAMTIAIVAAVIGMIIASIGGYAIADLMVGEDDGGDQNSGPGGQFSLPDDATEEQKQRFEEREGGNNQEEDDVISSISYSLTVIDLLKGFGVAVLMGGAGMLYPALQASRMKPVEALRNE